MTVELKGEFKEFCVVIGAIALSLPGETTRFQIATIARSESGGSMHSFIFSPIGEVISTWPGSVADNKWLAGRLSYPAIRDALKDLKLDHKGFQHLLACHKIRLKFPEF